jgi:hypothetical protein
MKNKEIIKIIDEIMNKGTELLTLFIKYYERKYGEYWTFKDQLTWGYAFILIGAYLLDNNEERMKAMDFAIYTIEKYMEEKENA